MVMVSSPKGLENFCIGNKISHLDKDVPKKIGNSDAHSKRQAYQAELEQIYERTQG
jgi:hypothetical protein